MATDPHVVNAFNRAIRHTNAPTQAARALVEAGIVESGLRNLNYGDRDSLGALQQRPSQGWKHATDPYAGALDFLAQAIPLANSGQYKTAGALAQAVQKSAYPGRYDQHRDEALSILGGLASPRPVTPGATGGTAPGSSSQPGATSPDLGGQGSDFAGLLSSLLAKPQTQTQAPMALQAPAFAAAPPLPQGFRGLLATQAPAPSAQTGVSDALGLISALGGSSPANGIPGASQTADGPQMAPAPTAPAQTPGGGFKGSKVLELIYNNGGSGFGIKNGQVVNGSQVFSDVWGGHKTHVHVAAGPKTVVQLGKLAQSMGLNVGENPHFGGVDPVHVKGSYHYKGEAIDVSGDPKKLGRFAQRVEQYNRTHSL